jgi:hypothetical protein
VCYKGGMTTVYKALAWFAKAYVKTFVFMLILSAFFFVAIMAHPLVVLGMFFMLLLLVTSLSK